MANPSIMAASQAANPLAASLLNRGSIAVDQQPNQMPQQTQVQGQQQVQGAGIGGMQQGGGLLPKVDLVDPAKEKSRQNIRGLLSEKQLMDALQRKGTLNDRAMDLIDAEGTVRRTQTDTMTSRGAIGFGEDVFDAIYAPYARKKAETARKEYSDTSLQNELANAKVVQEIELQNRADYVTAALPMMKASDRYNGMSEEQLTNVATQAAAQGLSIKELFPPNESGKSTAPNVKSETYEKDGMTYTRFRNMDNGKIMEGEGWEQYMSKEQDPTSPPTDRRVITKTLEDGSEWSFELGAPDKITGERPELNRVQLKPAIPEGADVKSMAMMSGEQRKQLNLATNAARTFSESVPFLMDGDSWNRTSGTPIAWGTERRAAYEGLKSTVFDVLRAETGAAITDSEVMRDVNRYVPDWNDSDIMARAKLNRLYGKLGTNYKGFTAGYNVEDPELGFTPTELFWNDGTDAEEVALATADLDLDQQFEDALRKAAAQAAAQAQ